MPQSQFLRTLRALVSQQSARHVLITSSVCRLSYAMFGLSMLLAVEHASGSLTTAAASSAGFSIMAMSTPWKARWVDRSGHRVPIFLFGAAFSASVLVIAALTRTGVRSAIVYVATCALAGLMSPPIGPAVRSLWAYLSRDLTKLKSVYSLDLVFEDALFTLGPVVVGLLVAVNGPVLALVISAVLMFVGTLSLISAPIAMSHVPRGSRSAPRAERSTLLTPQFIRLLLVVAALSSMLGAVEVAVAARALQMGEPARAGYLLAVLTFGGVIGGPLWAHQRWLNSTRCELASLALVAATAAIGFSSFASVWSLGASLLLFGAAMTPVLIVSFVAVQRVCPSTARTEATAWVSTAFNAGTALGTLCEGIAAGRHDEVFALNADALLVCMLGVVLLVRTLLAGSRRHCETKP